MESQGKSLGRGSRTAYLCLRGGILSPEKERDGGRGGKESIGSRGGGGRPKPPPKRVTDLHREEEEGEEEEALI